MMMFLDEIQPKKAESVFPFMEEINEEDLDVYDENFIEFSADKDRLNASEQGFMLGYLEA